MEFYNRKVAWYLLDVPVPFLLYRMVEAIDIRGFCIEVRELKSFLKKEIPGLRMPDTINTKYPEITDSHARDIIQELLHQDYLTFSMENPNLEKELYFKATEKAREDKRRP